MQVIYADTGLCSEAGHHANSCRDITAALRVRGHKVVVLSYIGIDQDLAADLDARPHFHVSTYRRTDGDPIAGWMFHFFSGASALDKELKQLGPLGPETLIYMNSIQPTQLMGLRIYLAGLPKGRRPIVFAEFGQEPGVDYTEVSGVGPLVARDPRHDPRATLYRFAGHAVRAAKLPELHLCTFDRDSSSLFSQVLEVPVQTLPVPRFTNAPARRRGRQGPVTVGVLGHQRPEKGYHLVPAIVQQMLRQRSDVRFLIHCSDPTRVGVMQADLHGMAQHDGRIELDERVAGPELWQSLLDRSDLILCPYDPKTFRAGYSAVTSEAIANAIPVVVPDKTTLSRVVEEFGGPGLAFREQTAPVIAACVNQALEQFEDLAERALMAAAQWRKTMGAGAMVDAMMADVAAHSGAAESLRQHAPAMAI